MKLGAKSGNQLVPFERKRPGVRGQMKRGVEGQQKRKGPRRLKYLLRDPRESAGKMSLKWSTQRLVGGGNEPTVKRKVQCGPSGFYEVSRLGTPGECPKKKRSLQKNQRGTDCGCSKRRGGRRDRNGKQHKKTFWGKNCYARKKWTIPRDDYGIEKNGGKEKTEVHTNGRTPPGCPGGCSLHKEEFCRKASGGSHREKRRSAGQLWQMEKTLWRKVQDNRGGGPRDGGSTIMSAIEGRGNHPRNRLIEHRPNKNRVGPQS